MALTRNLSTHGRASKASAKGMNNDDLHRTGCTQSGGRAWPQCRHWLRASMAQSAGGSAHQYAGRTGGRIILLLRPIVSFINRQPLMSTELEIGYVVSVTCRNPDEAHIRALLLQGLAGCGLALRRLDSKDLEGSGRVVVTAFMTASHRIDTDVEKIVGRLSLEPTVSAPRWQADVQIESETPHALDLSETTLAPDRRSGATGGSLS
jgi:hypothetical protein